MSEKQLKIYICDHININESVLETYGALNISLFSDFPLFIDPFLLFENGKEEYKKLHVEILRYVGYLRDRVLENNLSKGDIQHLFYFPEIKQNWLGYSEFGNSGRGLAGEFAASLIKNLDRLFSDTGGEKITRELHVEKLCIIDQGVGRDNISDFIANIIKFYLLDYSEKFAIQFLTEENRREVIVKKAYFNYELERWMPKKYTLPYIFDDYVILSPKDMLTKDENWINSRELINRFHTVAASIPNSQLQASISRYFLRNLPPTRFNRKGKPIAPSQKEVSETVRKVIEQFPEYVDYYIRFKESTGNDAKDVSKEKVLLTESYLIDKIKEIISHLENKTKFYQESPNSFDESKRRVIYLKEFIENNDGYKIFYFKDKAIKRESDLQLMFKLVWHVTEYDVNSEVNNGMGPVDFKIS